jgi:predicted dienelactone hydrolase
MSRRIVALAALALLASCAGSRQPSEDTKYRPLTGAYVAGATPLPVGVIREGVLHDAARNADVALSIDYPTRGGPYPVIVFSHAWGLSSESYTSLIEYWTGHGYICILPSHADAGAMHPIVAKRREEHRAAMEKRREEKGSRRSRAAEADQQSAGLTEPAAESYWAAETAADWTARAHEVAFVIDSLDALEQKYPELAGKMMKDHVAVAGHSLGAFTAMLAAGTIDYKTTPPLRLGDSRVKALLALSPQGISGDLGLTADSWKELKIPAMFITGSLDRAPGPSGDAAWRRDPFALSPAGDKFFISFTGARTNTFTGALADVEDLEFAGRGMRGQTTDVWGNPAAGSTQQQPRQSGAKGEGFFNRDRRIFAQVRTISTAFFDAYLKGDTVATTYVRPGGTLDMLKGEDVVVERK